MTKQPSASQVARSERMRVAAVEGAKARADFSAQDVAVRKNMERLRTLRLAKEAEEAAHPSPPSKPKKRATKAGSAKPVTAKKTAAKLSDWIREQESTGRKT